MDYKFGKPAKIVMENWRDAKENHLRGLLSRSKFSSEIEAG